MTLRRPGPAQSSVIVAGVKLCRLIAAQPASAAASTIASARSSEPRWVAASSATIQGGCPGPNARPAMETA